MGKGKIENSEEWPSVMEEKMVGFDDVVDSLKSTISDEKEARAKH